MTHQHLTVSILLAMASGSAACGQQAEFEGVGFLDLSFQDHTWYSEVFDVSFDGTVIVGESNRPGLEDGPGKCYGGPKGCTETSEQRGFSWQFGMTELAGAGEGPDECCNWTQIFSRAECVSPNGFLACGGAGGFTAKWEGGAGPTDIGGDNATVHALTDSGILVGRSYVNGVEKPVVWLGAGPQNLIPGAPDDAYGRAHDISADGTYIVGEVVLDGTPGAVLWTYENGAYTWEFIDDDPTLDALAISGDGSTIVGARKIDGVNTPIRHVDGEFEILGLPEGATQGFAHDVSHDGQIVLAEVVPYGPAMWNAKDGWRILETYLDDQGVLDGWTIDDATAISGDGTTIVGNGIDPDGFYQGYRAVVPRPTSIRMLAVGIDDANILKPLRGDLSAANVVAAFEELPGTSLSATLATYMYDPGNDLDGYQHAEDIDARIENELELLSPGDTFIFYIASHGAFMVPQGGDEAPVCQQTSWLLPFLCDDYDTDEVILLGADGHFYKDDDLHAKFSSPEWDQINKLFIIDSCMAGGFWGTTQFGDSGDLATLPKSAIIAASTEAEFSYGEVTTGRTYLSIAIVQALSEIEDAANLTFNQLLNAIIDVEGWIQETYGDKNGTYEGIIAGEQPFDFSEFYGIPAEAKFAPMGEARDDFTLTPGEPCPADCDADGQLNILDFVCFQGLFQAGDQSADCNGDGALNILDFVCYQAMFTAGCP